MNRLSRFLALTAALFLYAQSTYGLVFSIDPNSTITGIGPADILESFGGGFMVKATATDIGLVTGDNIDALHQGSPGVIGTWFSVDPSSTGLSGTDVDTQAQANEVAGDVFAALQLHNILQDNRLDADEDQLGLSVDDNIDAMHWSFFDPNVAFFFSLGPNSPTLTSNGWSAADILVHQNDTIAVWMTATNLGLDPTDDIDGLDGEGGPGTRFSLARGSQSLGSNSAAATWGPGMVLRNTANSMGLNAADNVDALASTFDCSLELLSDCKVPEPATLALLGLGLAGFAFSRRKVA